MADAEVNYCFNLAKTLGARAISCEIDAAHTERIGRFADKHKMMVGYHGHAATTPAHWEAAFAQAKFNWANLDIGHFVAGNNTSPVPFLKQHHARITHVHVKDRKMHEGATTPFGQGDTPIGEVLRLIRDNKWPIQATIEFEYPVPAGSDRMTRSPRRSNTADRRCDLNGKQKIEDQEILEKQTSGLLISVKRPMSFIHDDFLLQTQGGAAAVPHLRGAAADPRLPLPPLARRHRREPPVRQPLRDLARRRPLQVARDARERRGRTVLHGRRRALREIPGLGGDRAAARCAIRSTTGRTSN